MKKIIFTFVAACALISSANSQTVNYKKRATLGIHFFGNDFETPAKIKASSISDVLDNNEWGKVSDLNFGFGLNYLKGLSNAFDFSTSLDVSFVDYPIKDKQPDGKDGGLVEWDAVVHGKMFSDKYWVSPYLTAGVGASYWRGYFGAIVPLGVGTQVNFYDEAFLFIDAQYRLGITNTTSNHLYYSIGFAGNIGKPRAPKVIPPPPPPIVVDQDNDGIVDSLDACPTVAGLAALNGCPDGDSDGIADKDDKCPTVAGVAAYQGCPIPDTDNDGINDEQDKCKDVAGIAKYEGCPIPDRDGDGVNDEEDKCPDIPGVAEQGGCPNMETTKFNASAVQFVTGSATLTTKAKKALDEGALILNDKYPTTKLEIAGFTDNTGSVAGNQKLSQKRAEAVKAYLTKKGVAADRITPIGYGQDQPIADNKTSAGKAKNRRVEFKVTQ